MENKLTDILKEFEDEVLNMGLWDKIIYEDYVNKILDVFDEEYIAYMAEDRPKRNKFVYTSSNKNK